MKNQIVPLGTPWRIDDLKNALQDFPDIHIMDINDVEKYNPVLYLYYGHNENDAVITDRNLKEKLQNRNAMIFLSASVQTKAERHISKRFLLVPTIIMMW